MQRMGAPFAQGVGIASIWYGIGNTSVSNPSTMRIGLAQDGTVTLYSGAMDIGQGTNTTMVQCVADALGIEMSAVRLVWGDTALTADAGKTSASRQAYISGKAAKLAGEDLKRKLQRLANAGADAVLSFRQGSVEVRDNDVVRLIDLLKLEPGRGGDVLLGEGTFDPPTIACDANGQGSPYATYGFAAQIAHVEVDVQLGTVRTSQGYCRT